MKKMEKNMRCLVLVMLGFLIALNMNGQDLQQHQWKNRILVIQTSHEDNANYQSQLDEFSDLEAEMKERKLIVYTVVKDKYQLTDLRHKGSNDTWRPIEKRFKKILNQKDGFKVILIGLDGGVKHKNAEVLKARELFRIIDSMPMRSAEMRNSKKGNP